MISTVVAILIFVHALPWLFFPKRKLGKSPSKIISFQSTILVLPFFIYLAISPEQAIIFRSIGSTAAMNEILSSFGLAYSASLAAMYLGVFGGSKIPMPIFPANLALARQSPQTIGRSAYVLVAIAIAGILTKFQMAGGFFYYIANVENRVNLLAGTGALDLVITPALFISSFLLIYSRSLNGKPNLLVIIALISAMALLMSLFGARKTPTLLVLLCIIASTIYFPRLNLVSLRFMIAYALLLAFFVYVLFSRFEAQFGENIPAFGALEVLRNASYVDVYLFIYHHFTDNPRFGGTLFWDLLHKFWPVHEPNMSPPLDEGRYIRSIYQDGHLSPPVSVENLHPSSWPPLTFGSGFMNFGIGGVLLYSALKGIVSGVLGRYAYRTNYAPVPLFLMIYITLNFHISNLLIVQTAILIIGAKVLVTLINTPLLLRRFRRFK